ncbi:MAG TPA: DUF4384 domain-containing protein [Rhodocyclaceae bacterium]|nr:DUF4384 domain-containing protein [Rhodocyclaceae bacterium]
MQKNKRNLLATLIPTLILSSALMAGAHAETQALRQKAELKADHYTDAATIATLDKNASVDVIRRDGGWVLVKAGGRQGWLRSEAFTASASADASTPSAANDLLALSSGRSGGAGRNGLIATTGIRGIGKPKDAATEGYSKPPSAQVHALIMTIGAYQAPYQLDGVAKDADTAKEIAHRMGVTDANLHMLKDGDLTLDGIGRAFDDLEAQVQNNDQVFIYYSGHGGRQLVQEEGVERCAESLISVDGYGFIDAELEARLKRLSAKAQKVIVFIDACHSGGVTTRAVKATSGAFKAKNWNGKGMSEQSCAKPVNVLTRGINLAAKSPGSGGANYVYIAAARDNEISLDQPGKGGVASQAWLACMAGAAKDTDGSGGLSADEIRACAQDRIDQKLANATGYLPHHVTITGNPNVVLSYATKAAEVPSVPAPAAEPAAPAKPVAQPVALKPEPAPAPVAVAVKPRPMATLNDIYNNRDDRRLVTLSSARSKLRIGKDALDLTLTSREAGYVYLVMVGSDGETFDLLFPNQLDRNNQIQAGETLKLPRSSWQLTAQGPAGRDTLVAIVSDAPRDFAKAGLKPAGPFSSVEAVASKDIQLVTATSSEANSNECSAEGRQQTRNIAIQKRCSNAYGAALLTIDEAQ